jgi:hypothetical protein
MVALPFALSFALPFVLRFALPFAFRRDGQAEIPLGSGDHGAAALLTSILRAGVAGRE